MWTARRALAKVNLALEIVGLRPDGLHELAAVSQTIAWGDVVAVERPRAGARLAPGPPDPSAWPVLVSGAAGAPLDGDPAPNLVARAAAALVRAGHEVPRCRLWVVKRVPVGSGLGGGSADAAAALRLLVPGLDEAALARVALHVGADVPFALLGGTARLGGAGDQLEPLPPPPPTWCVVAVLGRILTADVYRRTTPAEHTDGRRVDRVVGALRGGRRLDPAWLGSGLEPAAGREDPRLVSAAAALRAATAPAQWALTGSGGAYFSLEPHRGRAVELAEAARAACPAAVVRVSRTVGRALPADASVA